MPWDYKRDFEFLPNVVKIQHTFYFLVGRTLYSEHSMNPLDLFFACRFFIQSLVKIGSENMFDTHFGCS